MSTQSVTVYSLDEYNGMFPHVSSSSSYPVKGKSEVTWNCRFHPGDWWHEVGCPHKVWTVEELRNALISKKRFEESGLVGKTLTPELYEKIKSGDY